MESKVINDYDSEPVKYCPKCYSLQIGSVEGSEDTEYCMKCGCSEIAEASIEDWERLYENRYGRKFVERPRDPYRNHIYQMDLPELKMELFGRGDYRKIIERLYPRFPKYLSRADAIILFFDKAGKEGDLGTVRDLMSRKEQI